MRTLNFGQDQASILKIDSEESALFSRVIKLKIWRGSLLFFRSTKLLLIKSPCEDKSKGMVIGTYTKSYL